MDIFKSKGFRIAEIIAVVLIYVLVSNLTIPGLSPTGVKAFSLLIAFVLTIVLDLLPIGVIGLLFSLLFPFLGIMPEANVFSNLVVGASFFVVGVFMLAVAFEDTGFGYRVSLYVSGLLGNKSRNVALSYMMVTSVVSMFLADIPTALIFATLAAGLLKENGCMPGESNFGRLLILGIPIAATIGGLGTPAGGALNVVTMSMVKATMGYDITFLQWTIVCAPFALIMTFVSWFMLCKIFKPEIDVVEGLEGIKEKRKELGKMTPQEWKFVIIFAGMVILWLTQSLHGIALWTVTIFGVTLLFLPGIDVLSWHKTSPRVGWNIAIMICFANVLTVALVSSGCAAWIADKIGFIAAYPQWAVIFALVFINVIGHYIIPGSVPVIAVLVPIAVAMAAQMGFNPLALAFAICVGAHMTTIFPMADGVALVTYQHGYWTAGDATKAAIPIALVYTVLGSIAVIACLALGVI